MMKYIKSALALYGFVFCAMFFYQGIKHFRTGTDVILFLFITPPLIYFVGRAIERLFTLKPNFDTNVIVKITRPTAQLSLLTTLLIFMLCVVGMFFKLEPTVVLLILPLPLYFILTGMQTHVEVKVVHTENPLIIHKNTWLDVASASSELVLPARKKKTKKGSAKGLTIFGEEIGSLPISDQRRREFLKVIGTTGVGLFIALILNPKRAEAAFFGSVPGPGTIAVKDSEGNKIDPAIKSPTDAYGICEVDSTGPYYYGYVNKVGQWYIVREGDDGTFRYAKGDSGFAATWATRGALSYGYFDSAF